MTPLLQLHLTLPAWLHEFPFAAHYPGDEAKMALAIELSRHNVEAGSGGPFGAAIFGADDRLIAIGVNRVVPMNCSVAHAEMMAFMLAQQRLQRPRLNRNDDGSAYGPVTLATSAMPCCQCFGASIWAGIDRLLMGARSQDVEALTHFDEGPLPHDWMGSLNQRGIEVIRDLQREAACEVLRSYTAGQGASY
ncbi:tRNA-specific adenosine deaminase [Lysobacteraceae bacterium NML08-0793]|nr:tRNA-specific adenosine deaminase [Xanthomonadaceae bacterium NML08-0793]